MAVEEFIKNVCFPYEFKEQFSIYKVPEGWGTGDLKSAISLYHNQTNDDISYVQPPDFSSFFIRKKKIVQALMKYYKISIVVAENICKSVKIAFDEKASYVSYTDRVLIDFAYRYQKYPEKSTIFVADDGLDPMGQIKLLKYIMSHKSPHLKVVVFLFFVNLETENVIGRKLSLLAWS